MGKQMLRSTNNGVDGLAKRRALSAMGVMGDHIFAAFFPFSPVST